MTQSESIFTKIKPYFKVSTLAAELEYLGVRFVDVLFRQPWYWFRCHFIRKHKFHILDLRRAGNGYSWGWYDTDSRMLHACFLLLKDYVELEKPFENVDWEENDYHSNAAKEIRELYRWWTVERPATRKELHDAWESCPEYSRFEKDESGEYKIIIPEAHKILTQRQWDYEQEDQRNLERLVKIRGFLWT